jgi:hypothetical protein
VLATALTGPDKLAKFLLPVYDSLWVSCFIVAPVTLDVCRRHFPPAVDACQYGSPPAALAIAFQAKWKPQSR